MRTPEEIKKDIEGLKRELRIAQDTSAPHCKLCDSRMRKTQRGYKCIEDNGNCGQLILSAGGFRSGSHAFWTPTSWTREANFDETMMTRPQYPTTVLMYFISGEEVPESTYMALGRDAI